MGTEHFDERAATWDEDVDKVARAQDVARAVRAAVPVGPGTRLLDYGAGTGLVTQALADRTDGLTATLADNSSGMRDVLERKVAAGALPAGTRIWDLDLDHDPTPPERFGLVVSSMVLHHVRDLDTVLAGLAGLLDEGGHLCIADLDREDGSFHAHLHDFDGHHGFDRAELTAALARAGLTEVDITDCTRIERDGTPYPVFLATARRAGPSTAPDDTWTARPVP